MNHLTKSISSVKKQMTCINVCTPVQNQSNQELNFHSTFDLQIVVLIALLLKLLTFNFQLRTTVVVQNYVNNLSNNLLMEYEKVYLLYNPVNFH